VVQANCTAKVGPTHPLKQVLKPVDKPVSKFGKRDLNNCFSNI
jgi:hypothetical protein